MVRIEQIHKNAQWLQSRQSTVLEFVRW